MSDGIPAAAIGFAECLEPNTYRRLWGAVRQPMMKTLWLIPFVCAAWQQIPTDPIPTPDFAAKIKELTTAITANPKMVSLYSQRGDAEFFSGHFAQAVADYDRMVELDPTLDASHWRRGIALFYAGEYARGARQFEIYHSFDNVDRENGIWRYLCQHKAYGREKAREGLLKYAKDDREPFPSVYRLFSGEMTADDVLKGIESAKVEGDERQKRLFYAHLYVGLNEYVEGRTDTARKSLELAARNPWGQAAGGGPGYMWHVARVHYQQLRENQGQGQKERVKREAQGGALTCCCSAVRLSLDVDGTFVRCSKVPLGAVLSKCCFRTGDRINVRRAGMSEQLDVKMGSWRRIRSV